MACAALAPPSCTHSIAPKSGASSSVTTQQVIACASPRPAPRRAVERKVLWRREEKEGGVCVWGG